MPQPKGRGPGTTGSRDGRVTARSEGFGELWILGGQRSLATRGPNPERDASEPSRVVRSPARDPAARPAGTASGLAMAPRRGPKKPRLQRARHFREALIQNGLHDARVGAALIDRIAIPRI